MTRRQGKRQVNRTQEREICVQKTQIGAVTSSQELQRSLEKNTVCPTTFFLLLELHFAQIQLEARGQGAHWYSSHKGTLSEGEPRTLILVWDSLGSTFSNQIFPLHPQYFSAKTLCLLTSRAILEKLVVYPTPIPF